MLSGFSRSSWWLPGAQTLIAAPYSCSGALQIYMTTGGELIFPLISVSVVQLGGVHARSFAVMHGPANSFVAASTRMSPGRAQLSHDESRPANARRRISADLPIYLPMAHHTHGCLNHADGRSCNDGCAAYRLSLPYFLLQSPCCHCRTA
ncbi:uncharacterized protein BDV14DRAFT_48493 [Aspergillus stella-maris]|uniref:uncharacterized protein n=1 Tax=Aspergillus stella-maris TaxID=1810926 RepID=UPI003CCCB987